MLGVINSVISSAKTPDEITVGMPATALYVSDRVAMEVTAVELFKTGERKGQLKAVWASYPNDPTGGIRYVMRTSGKLVSAGGTPLVVGVADDYRDPSF